MAKKPERSELEYLRGENRRLQSENRNLKKRNKQLERKQHLYDPYEPDEEFIQEYHAPAKPNCPQCGKGVVTVVIEFADREIEACDLCNYRKVNVIG